MIGAIRFYWRLSQNYDHPWPRYLSLRGRLQFTALWTVRERLRVHKLIP